MTTHAVGADNRKMYTINVAFPHLLPSSPTSFPFEKGVLMKKNLSLPQHLNGLKTRALHFSNWTTEGVFLKKISSIQKMFYG